MIGMKIPVFVVNGFLESGKTVFAMDTIEDEYFSDGEDTLIIACEEGMEEYDEDLLARHGAKIVYCDSKEEFTEEFLKEVIKHPEIVLFIDEIHTAIGTGLGENGGNDLAQILKPYLDRGKIKVIGSTTDYEYEKLYVYI